MGAESGGGFRPGRHLVAEGCIYRGAIGFHSQQASEKFVKAHLVLHQIDFPRTHNLGELLDLVAGENSELAALLHEITALNPYGVEYRYPGDFPQVTQEDAETAFRPAERVRTAIMPGLVAHLEGAWQGE